MTFILTLFLYEIQSELSHTLAYPPLLKCRGVGYLRVEMPYNSCISSYVFLLDTAVDDVNIHVP
jgi:hypothetical protein